MKLNDLPTLPARNAATDAAWQRVYAEACAPYRSLRQGPFRWSWHWARGKLAHDPVFRSMLERGDLRGKMRVVDIGCGQGLVAALLNACASAQPWWPAEWPPAPSATAYTGVELMQRDADRARSALQQLAFAPGFICGDMRSTPLPACDLVVILDVLHYVDHAAQQAVLQRVHDALAQSAGRLLLRVGDATARRRFAVSQWVDRIVTAVRGHRAAPTWGRPLNDWKALLQSLGFVDIQMVPMSQGTPFANVLLVADLARNAR